LFHLAFAITSAASFSIVGFAFKEDIYRHIQKKYLYITKLALFSALVTSAELLRSYGLSVVMYGEGGDIGLHFTIGTLGEALINTPLLPLAYGGGIFFLTGICACSVYLLVTKRTLFVYGGYSMLLLVLFVWAHSGDSRLSSLSFGVVTSDFATPPDSMLEESFKKQGNRLHAETLKLASSSPLFIVYGEDSRYLTSIKESDFFVLKNLFPATLFIDGNTKKESEGLMNVSFFYTPVDDTGHIATKSFLFPFNEYIPYAFRGIFKLFAQEDSLNAYADMHTYVPHVSEKTFTYNNIRLGALICSEGISFTTINRVRKENPDIIIMQSKLSVFHRSLWYGTFVKRYSKLIAAQTHKPVISNNDSGHSYIINERGVLLHTLPLGTRSYTVSHGDIVIP
jgi:apolipoprotein N-acyltransferase